MKNRLTIGDNQTVACFICGERGSANFETPRFHRISRGKDSTLTAEFVTL